MRREAHRYQRPYQRRRPPVSINAADEEADDPQGHPDEQDEPQDVRGESEAAEQDEEKQQHDQSNHFILLFSSGASHLSTQPGGANSCTPSPATG